MAEEKKQEQVVQEVIEEEYIEEPGRWTFLKYIKSIAKFKWWVIGFTLFGALAGYLGFRFLLNTEQKVLSATYTYDLAGSYTDSDTMVFIDGTLFNPYELTSRDNLQKIKDNNEKYASVDIDKIIANSAIVISKNATLLNEKDTTSNVEINYVISAKAKYFKTDELGKSFLYDVINLAKDLSTNAINNYEGKIVFADNFDTLTFDRQIGLLSDQYSTTYSSYSELIGTFGYVASGNANGTKLNELLTGFVSQYYISGVSSFASVLTGQKDANKYVNYVIGQEETKIEEIHNLCISYIQTIKNNKKSIAVYEDRLDKLLASTSFIGSDSNVSGQITLLNSQITSLELSNSELDKELNNNGYFVNGSGEYAFDPSNEDTTIYKLTQKEAGWVNANKLFGETIRNYKSSLMLNNEELTNTYKYCYSQYKNKINIQNGGYIALTGKVSNILGAGIGLAAGFVISSIVTSLVYVYREEK